MQGPLFFFQKGLRLAAPIPAIEPLSFSAGETVQWTKAIASYPSTDGWTLVYSLRGPVSVPDISAVGNSDGTYSITLTAAGANPTNIMQPGRYEWVSHVTMGTGAALQRFLAQKGVFAVRANFVGGIEAISWSADTLVTLEASIKSRLAGDVQSYSIAGRSINKIPIRELYSMRAQCKAAIWRENNPGLSGPVRAITFVQPR